MQSQPEQRHAPICSCVAVKFKKMPPNADREFDRIAFAVTHRAALVHHAKQSEMTLRRIETQHPFDARIFDGDERVLRHDANTASST